MRSIPFWHPWQAPHRYVGIALASCFVFSLFFLWYAHLRAPTPALAWESMQELEHSQVAIHDFEQGPLTLTIHGDNHIVFDYLFGGPLKIDPITGYMLLGSLAIWIVVVLTILVRLKRFSYSIGMGLFILFIVSFHVETLHLFGLADKTFTVLLLLVYLVPSIYFQFFKKDSAFTTHLVVFAIITLGIGIVIVVFSSVPHPLLLLSAHSITVATLIGAVFILTVAPEIIAAFIQIVSKGKRNNLRHFLIISTLYLITLTLTYTTRIGIFEQSVTYINLFLLLTLSSLLGIGGIRQRTPQYDTILPMNPWGVFGILAMGTVCFTLIGYFIRTANDAPLASIDDIILFSHIGYGFLFVIYIIANFISPLGQNMPVYKVLYQPINMPYFTFRFAGLIMTLAFVFYTSWQVIVNNIIAGKNNALAAYYLYEKNVRTAEAFYRQAGTYGFLNHHSYYSLATIEKLRHNRSNEKKFYQRANQQRPTEFSYLNLSQTFYLEHDWLNALLVIKEGEKKISPSGVLDNMTGLIYAKLNLIDSSLVFLQKAMGSTLTNEIANANFIGVLAKNNSPVVYDSLVTLTMSDNPGVKINSLALANLQQVQVDLPIKMPNDSLLDVFSASLLNNYIINHLTDIDSVFVKRVISLARLPSNIDFKESLLFVSALALYEIGEIWKAFALLEEVTIFSNQQGKYNNILALWSLEQKSPKRALLFLTYARIQHYAEARLTKAVAHAENGDIKKALVAWNLLKKQDSIYEKTANQAIRALSVSATQTASLSDEEKYLYCRYRSTIRHLKPFFAVVNSMKNDDIKAKAIIEMSEKLVEYDKTKEAVKILQTIKGLVLHDNSLRSRLLYLDMNLLAKQKKYDLLTQRMNDSSLVALRHRKGENRYFNTLIRESKKNDAEVSKNYHWLAHSNPYHEEAIIAAAQFFQRQDKNEKTFQAYNILIDALHYNPHAVNLLKAYILEATRMGMTDYAHDALDDLRPLIDTQTMREFMVTYRQSIPSDSSDYF